MYNRRSVRIALAALPLVGRFIKPPAWPKPFEPGSDILRDLQVAAFTATIRVKEGQEPDFGQALYHVLHDQTEVNAGRKHSGKRLLDWNNKRVEARHRGVS